jgi:ABC-type multidrug transport system fused ATPase/permease subunit
VLIRLLRTYLRPYRKPLAFLLVLQLAQTLATLYLPTLNADIIDNGVVFHNTHYILVTGGWMLAIMTFTLLLSAPIMCVGGIILALNQNVPLLSLLLVAVPVLAILLTMIISRMRPLFRQMQVRLDGINGVLREQITGVRVIRAFVRDPQERESSRRRAASCSTSRSGRAS